MNEWYLVKVKYVKVDDNGREKKVTEPYLFNAISFTDAEKRAYNVMEQYIRGSFSIQNMGKTKFTDVYNFEDAQIWFKCKLVYNDVDEKTERVKKVTNYSLIAANDVKDCYNRVNECYKDMLVPFDIPSIQESPILDVFDYFEMN